MTTFEDLEHRVRQVQRPVLEDVDLDALEQRHTVNVFLDLGHLL